MSVFVDNFAKGFQIGDSWRRGNDEWITQRAVRKAGDQLAELMSFDPLKQLQTASAQQPAYAGTSAEAGTPPIAEAGAAAGEAGTQVVPTPAAEPSERRGLAGLFSRRDRRSISDGTTWAEAKGEYLRTISRISDPGVQAAMRQQLADIEKNKILGYLSQAYSASTAGDRVTAATYLQAAGTLMYPGIQSDVSPGPRGSFVVVNKGQDGSVLGGYALRPAAIADMMMQVADMNTWARLAWQNSRLPAGGGGGGGSGGGGRSSTSTRNAGETEAANEARNVSSDMVETMENEKKMEELALEDTREVFTKATSAVDAVLGQQLSAARDAAKAPASEGIDPLLPGAEAAAPVLPLPQDVQLAVNVGRGPQPGVSRGDDAVVTVVDYDPVTKAPVVADVQPDGSVSTQVEAGGPEEPPPRAMDAATLVSRRYPGVRSGDSGTLETDPGVRQGLQRMAEAFVASELMDESATKIVLGQLLSPSGASVTILGPVEGDPRFTMVDIDGQQFPIPTERTQQFALGMQQYARGANEWRFKHGMLAESDALFMPDGGMVGARVSTTGEPVIPQAMRGAPPRPSDLALPGSSAPPPRPFTTMPSVDVRASGAAGVGASPVVPVRQTAVLPQGAPADISVSGSVAGGTMPASPLNSVVIYPTAVRTEMGSQAAALAQQLSLPAPDGTMQPPAPHTPEGQLLSMVNTVDALVQRGVAVPDSLARAAMELADAASLPSETFRAVKEFMDAGRVSGAVASGRVAISSSMLDSMIRPVDDRTRAAEREFLGAVEKINEAVMSEGGVSDPAPVEAAVASLAKLLQARIPYQAIPQAGAPGNDGAMFGVPDMYNEDVMPRDAVVDVIDWINGLYRQAAARSSGVIEDTSEKRTNDGG
jgi:hypothetical protein